MFCFYYIKTEHDIKTEQVIFPRRIKDPDEVDDQKVEHILFRFIWLFFFFIKKKK
jgi:hypothetical protein